MQVPWKYCLIATMFLHVAPQVSQAQMVQVAPGYVRAPFVRVYRDPYGTHVRAPFVDVYRPNFGLRRGFIPQPGAIRPAPVPTPVTYGSMSWRALGLAVADAAARLERDLARLPDADQWRNSLHLEEVTALVGSQPEAPEEPVRAHLQDIAGTYRTLGDRGDERRITALASFQNLRDALDEYTLPPDVRSRQQLYTSSGTLRHALQQFRTAQSWQEYLALDPGSALSREQADAEPEQIIPALAALVARFDSINASPEFSMIAALPAFQESHERLLEYLEIAHYNQVSGEELPAPRPSR